MGWADWWVWGAAALALAILELVAPAFVLLGFAIGAAAVAMILFFGSPLAGSLPWLLVIFAVLSALAWYALRAIFGVRTSEVKHWDKDINDDV